MMIVRGMQGLSTGAATAAPRAGGPTARRGRGEFVAAPRKGPVYRAVELDLREIAKRDPELAGGAVAATALSLARSMDDTKTSATARATCAARLMDALDKLRALAPTTAKESELDKFRARRAARQGRAGT